MERLLRDSNTANSFNPYTCLVKQELLYECLDIASARTLGESISYEVASRLSEDEGHGGVYDSTAVYTLAMMEEDGIITMNRTDSLFGGDVLCDDKRVGDGAVNVYDISTLLWYQFSSPPYDLLSRDPTFVQTVQGRSETSQRCDRERSKAEWMLAVGDDYCALRSTTLEPPPPPPLLLPPPAPPSPPTLDDEEGTCHDELCAVEAEDEDGDTSDATEDSDDDDSSCDLCEDSELEVDVDGSPGAEVDPCDELCDAEVEDLEIKSDELCEYDMCTSDDEIDNEGENDATCSICYTEQEDNVDDDSDGDDDDDCGMCDEINVGSVSVDDFAACDICFQDDDGVDGDKDSRINDDDDDPSPAYDKNNENKHGTRCAG